MSFFSRGEKSKTEGSHAKKKTSDVVSAASDEKERQEAAAHTPWIESRRRHVDIYQGLASSVAQWRLAAFAMLVLLFFSVLANISLAKNAKVLPYVIQVDQHGYAIPVKELNPSGVDQRFVSAQIGMFIINSRTRVSDFTAQLMFAQNSYKSVSDGSNAAKTLNDNYIKEPPTRARYPVSVQVLSAIPVTNDTYEASWVERVIADGEEHEFGYIGTFNVVLSPPTTFDQLIENPLGVYITDYNIIRTF
jgi:type IV secretion system protein VirB5